ncbi:hypothetical protein L593_15150 [Salinarchaeum sp. Harcht-Bsk1]|uniref:hypothetical protein n=1 Tax=Salinarchaeum sp. Harcht-Bsk1 TaxID=1333523 RepID=UPI000342400E|nr:hypothetical protein [Salinarchaeum sp. Harcht-Bsk1]AGN02964.1 hypothetical protein L593_15150 [Salinarchaeum sp. Harcht-Bsk1]
MSDPLASLSALADRVDRARGDGSLESERAVQLRAVEPLLETLGWDVRGREVVPDASVDAVSVDYLLAIDSTPALVVETVPPGTDVRESTTALARVIDDDTVDRGIVTDGESIVLLVDGDDGVHRRSLPFDALQEHADALGQYHRSVVERSISAAQSGEREAARRLAAERDAVVTSVTQSILDVTGDAVEPTVAAAAESFVDSLAESLESPGSADGTTDGPSRESDATSSVTTPPPEHSTPDTRTEHPDANTERDEVTAVESGASPESEPEIDSQDAGGDGEYVVRFFGGTSSVGAVGTETPRGTTVGTVRYLLENHGLLGSTTLPWRTDDGTVVLAESPGGPNWIALDNDAGNAVYVRPIREPAMARSCIEELATAAGLRVMFQGDW